MAQPWRRPAWARRIVNTVHREEERRTFMITNIADLDKDQQAALRLPDRSLLLHGGSASGKTTILGFRIQQAVESLAEGDGQVLVLAPTDGAEIGRASCRERG